MANGGRGSRGFIGIALPSTLGGPEIIINVSASVIHKMQRFEIHGR